MPRNGTGTYTLVNNTWYPPVNGVLAQSSDWTPFIDDVASALTQSVSKDGQTPMTGNLPMGNNKITGLANGTAATDAAAFGQVAQIVGQCQLALSGANLLLSPYNGNRLFINGTLCSIPAAGVSLAPTSLAASTVYNIYAVATAGVVTSLEASTTARATDVTYGNQIKTGDATRALVGKARTTAGVAWADTDAQRFVVSWFNRRPLRIRSTTGSNQVSGSLTPVAILSNMEYLAWGDYVVPASFIGTVSNNTINGRVFTALGINSVLAFTHNASIYQAYGGGTSGVAAGGTVFSPTEGFQAIGLLGDVDTGTGTWIANIEMTGVIQG